MISASLARIAIITVIAVSDATGAWSHQHGQKARVRFLATSTLVRSTWGLNEDTYLVEVFTAHGNEFLISLVDAHPNETPAPSVDALTSDNGTLIWIQRDPQCVRLYEQMMLHTAPGDRVTILPAGLAYLPRLGDAPPRNAILQCHRRVRPQQPEDGQRRPQYDLASYCSGLTTEDTNAN